MNSLTNKVLTKVVKILKETLQGNKWVILSDAHWFTFNWCCSSFGMKFACIVGSAICLMGAVLTVSCKK